MKIHNRNKQNSVRVFFYIALVTLIADFLLNQIDGTISNLFESHWLAYSSGFIFLTLIIIRFNYFSFEIDHEIVHIQTKPFLLGFIKSKGDINFEFPKRNLHNFQILKSPFGQILKVSLQTLKGEKSTERFLMSFVNDHQSQKVLSGLEKIIKENKQINS